MLWKSPIDPIPSVYVIDPSASCTGVLSGIKLVNAERSLHMGFEHPESIMNIGEVLPEEETKQVMIELDISIGYLMNIMRACRCRVGDRNARRK